MRANKKWKFLDVALRWKQKTFPLWCFQEVFLCSKDGTIASVSLTQNKSLFIHTERNVARPQTNFDNGKWKQSLEGTSVNAHGVINSDIEFTPIHKHWRSACVCVHVCESPRVAVREPHVHAVLAGEGVCAEESVWEGQRLAGEQQAGNRRRGDAHLQTALTVENLKTKERWGQIDTIWLYKCVKWCCFSLTFHVADLRLALLPLFVRALLTLITKSLFAPRQTSSKRKQAL